MIKTLGVESATIILKMCENLFYLFIVQLVKMLSQIEPQ